MIEVRQGEFAPPQPRNCETRYARFTDAAIHRCFLRPGVSLRQGLPEVEVAPMHTDVITVIALILSALLLGYLAVTLLFPEKF
jgi:K+-transporting ATPase KdpF subunit